MNIRLTLAPEKFYLLGPSNDTKVPNKILDATLFVSHSDLKAPLPLTHANIVGMTWKANYPVTLTQIKSFTANSGSQKLSIYNAFLGHIPERVILGIFKNTLSVDYGSTNPFYFHHYDMTSMVLCVNGVQYHSEPLTMDCSLT
jgi:hypothetical protein